MEEQTKMEGQAEELHRAITKGDIQRLKVLLAQGAPVNAPDHSGWPGLFVAADSQNLEAVRLLLAHKADVNFTTSQEGLTVLHVLGEQRDFPPFDENNNKAHSNDVGSLLKLWKLLIDAGANPEAPSLDLETPLHLVCLRGNVHVVKFLLENGHIHNINATNRNGDTPLHYASRKGFKQIIDLLVEHGADVEISGSFGTAAQVAQEFSQEEIVQLLAELRTSGVPIWSVPQEILVRMFSFLTTAEDLCRVCQVCRAFAAISRDDSLWKPLCHPQWPTFPMFKDLDWKTRYLTWLENSVQFVGVENIPQPPINSSADYDLLLKLLFTGDSGVGKSSLRMRYADDTFNTSYISTIGVDFKIRTISVHDKKIKLQIWDTSGPERFRTITSAYYRGAHGIIVVFDVMDISSFNNVNLWLQDIERYSNESCKLILVGNKIDCIRYNYSSSPVPGVRQVTREMALQLCESYSHPLPYCETSAATGEGVEEAFLTLVHAILGIVGVPGIPNPSYIPPEHVLNKLAKRKHLDPPPKVEEKRQTDKCNVC
jgi:Ras-related protein Rab-1A